MDQNVKASFYRHVFCHPDDKKLISANIHQAVNIFKTFKVGHMSKKKIFLKEISSVFVFLKIKDDFIKIPQKMKKRFFWKFLY